MMVTKEKMIEFADKHGLYIHPKVVRHWEDWLKNTNELGHCPCSPKRPECPCPQCVEEVKNSKRGSCTCTTFVNDIYIKRFAYHLKLEKKDFYIPKKPEENGVKEEESG